MKEKETELRGISVHETISDGYGNFITICKNPQPTDSVMINDYYKKFIFDKSDKASNSLVEIVDLYVVPSKRRKGIGSMLIHCVIDSHPDDNILVSVGALQKYYNEELNDELREEALRELKLFFEANRFVNVNDCFKSYQHTCSYMYKKSNTIIRLTSKSPAEIKRNIAKDLPTYTNTNNIIATRYYLDDETNLVIESHSECASTIKSYCQTKGELIFLSSKQAKKILINFDNNSSYSKSDKVGYEHKFCQDIKDTYLYDYESGIIIPDESCIKNYPFSRCHLDIINRGNNKCAVVSGDKSLIDKINDGVQLDLIFIPFISEEEKIKEDEESNKLKKHIIIKTNSNEEMHYMGNCIYEQLVGNQDYIDSRIILSMEPDGEETKNEIHVLVFNDSKSNPEIII